MLCSLTLCKEVMDGLRVLFDFHLRTHLLYGEEAVQADALATSSPPYYLLNASSAPMGDDSSDQDDHKIKTTEDKTREEGGGGGRRMTRSSGGRMAVEASAPSSYACESGRSTPVTTSSSDGPLQHQTTVGGGDGGAADGGVNTGPLLSSLGPLSQELVQWTLLPASHRRPGIPALLYGPLHLLRLFVKLPEILYRMNLPLEKRKIVLKHLQLFLEYLEVHSQEFFSESFYVSSSTEKV
ncbi:MRG domain [Trinorchestia longiramus]|nr:MRG domain [Trinorchestia longiramus]